MRFALTLSALTTAAIVASTSVSWAAIVQQARLTASNIGYSDHFGSCVAISGDTLVVGAPEEDSDATGVNGSQGNNNAPDSGAAYIFVRSGTNWMQQAYLKASNTGGQYLADGYGDRFGGSVAVSGNTVVVGAGYESSSATGVNGSQADNSAPRSGAAYVFVRNGTNWIQQAYLKASNTGARDFFGAVAISDDTIVIGAGNESSNATGINGDQNNNGASESGAAYVFVRHGTNWEQQAYLKASNTDARDYFSAVAISGATIVIGAPGESSNAKGINENQGDNSATNSGAAYIFVRSGTNWSQQAYLKASNTGPGDTFGSSVAISGDTVAIGAPLESSSAAGINGDQNSNGTPGAGAAYIFARSGTNWSQQVYLKASNPRIAALFGSSVDCSGDTVIVGGHDSPYVFVGHGTTWVQHAHLEPPAVELPSYFGNTVRVSGTLGVVGAYLEGSLTTQVDAGAVYVFAGLARGPQLRTTSDGSGGQFICFSGVPDVSYILQRAADVTGPWDDIATNTAPASGFIEHHETNAPPGQAFYRTVQP